MAMPAVPGAGLVVVETEFVLGGLEAVFDRPTMPFHPDQGFDRGALRAPCREESEITVGDVAADQKAACPDADEGVVIVAGVEIGQFQISPVMKTLPLRARAGREALPDIGGQILGDIPGGPATISGLAQERNICWAPTPRT